LDFGRGFKQQQEELSLSMAAAANNVREIGGNIDGSSSEAAYGNLQLKKTIKQQNKFGIMYYLTERLYLRKSDAAVINYSTWESDDKKNVYLVLNFDPDLNSHLNLVMDSMQKSTPELPDFKRNSNGERHFIKLASKIGPIEENMALKYIVQVYGVFVKTSDKLSYLQMEVMEIDTQPFSLLSGI
jgi:hypothetical protein